MYGGSISAILLNTPGTPAAAATCIEGYPMAKNGQAGEALGMAAVASYFGGTVSVIALIFLAPPLASFALKFGPLEYFFLALCGMSIVISLSDKSMTKGFIAAVLGLLFGTVGMDPIVGFERYTFGSLNVMTGLPLVPTLVGLLSTSQLFLLAEEKSQTILRVSKILGKVVPTWADIKRLKAVLIRSSVIGTIIGALPGAGANISTFLAYDDAKRISKHPEKFGTGIVDGIAATESANNAITGGALATMLTLGIPGSNTTAILLGGLMIHGLQPGPGFFAQSTVVAYTFMVGLLLSNFVMLAFGLIFVRAFMHVVKIPNNILIAVVMMLSVVGSYAINNSFFDVSLMLAFGVVGYVLRKGDISVVPIVLGLVLGPIAEKGLRRAIVLSKGSYMQFFLSRPISIILALLTVLFIVWPIIKKYRSEKDTVKV
jgi:putative tricarboxylic transport membrane protein